MGKQETLETIWEVPDELWERIEPIILEEDPPKARAASALTHDRCSTASSSGCAQRVPMEPIAERAWGRQHHSSHLSTVGGDGRLAPNVGSPGGGVRRVGWRGLGMAGGRRSHGQGTFWGDLIGPNPTDRGKAGTKRRWPRGDRPGHDHRESAVAHSSVEVLGAADDIVLETISKSEPQMH